MAGTETAGRGRFRAQMRAVGTVRFGTRSEGHRHPLVAVAMVVPLAIILAVVFGAVQMVITQASSVAGMLGH